MAWRGAMARRVMPFTTPYVLLECGNAASRRPYRGAVDSVRQQFEQAGALVWPTNEEWQQAWRAYAADKPGGPGIVDHVSFIIMRRLGIAEAFTNDRHFTTAGFHTLF